ncbi:hypothetical protein EPH95_00280 [Salicibibacter halophilus]|uniref:LysM domain-containing protein n=1 Tax=Salicibibacter halophilus TaxID=2502791 RepID=A0A514LDB2_9BACI|nr:hypothetical protein [Salicibibacter halophilus]QDI89804.1 hypothetical protein EPH95_00280 [Salicibibacter halophilus]
MKKWFWILAIATIIFAIYYDVTRGTLPVVDPSPETTNETMEITQTHFDHTVDVEIEAGQTLLTIVEQLHDEGMPMDMAAIKNDFQYLNDGQPPEQLHEGNVYTFPFMKAEPSRLLAIFGGSLLQ